MWISDYLVSNVAMATALALVAALVGRIATKPQVYSRRLGSSKWIVNWRGPFSRWSNSHRTFQRGGSITHALWVLVLVKLVTPPVVHLPARYAGTPRLGSRFSSDDLARWNFAAWPSNRTPRKWPSACRMAGLNFGMCDPGSHVSGHNGAVYSYGPFE